MATPVIATSEPVAGTCFVTRNGATLRLGAKCTYSVAPVERKTKGGLSGIYGFTEMPRGKFMEIEVIDSGGTRVEDFSEGISDSVTLELINGKVVTGAQLWTTTPSEVDAAEGAFTVRWEGSNIRELTKAA